MFHSLKIIEVWGKFYNKVQIIYVKSIQLTKCILSGVLRIYNQPYIFIAYTSKTNVSTNNHSKNIVISTKTLKMVNNTYIHIHIQTNKNYNTLYFTYIPHIKLNKYKAIFFETMKQIYTDTLQINLDFCCCCKYLYFTFKCGKSICIHSSNLFICLSIYLPIVIFLLLQMLTIFSRFQKWFYVTIHNNCIYRYIYLYPYMSANGH